MDNIVQLGNCAFGNWTVSFLIRDIHKRRYASAFHYLSASINLRPEFSSSYMYLGVTLARLDDFENACCAYEKALELER